MAKQAIKKKTVNLDFINNLKAELKGKSANKPIEFIELPSGYQAATKLSGIPMGQLTLVFGHSNTGKSSMVNGVIVGCQKKGIWPVIIDTENNFSFNYAKKYGMEAEPVMGKLHKERIDMETGEVIEYEEDGIVEWTGNFIYFNQASLLAKYGDMDYSTGKKSKTRRTVPCIEDVALCIKELLDAQDNGDIPFDLCFIWDSVGSVSSFDSLMSQNQQNMRDANKLKEAFKTVIPRITGTNNQSCEHHNTMFAVNKVWVDTITTMGKPKLKLSGGEGLYYYARLAIQLGGNANASTTRLTAVSKGQTYNYGLETKIRVDKNHLDSPHDLTYEGKMACVSDGLIPCEAEDEWKRTHMKEIVASLNSLAKDNGADEISEGDVTFENTLNETV